MVTIEFDTLSKHHLQVVEINVDALFGVDYWIEKGDHEFRDEHQDPYEWWEYRKYF